ncbi:MAG: preprotein translocase subunit YajC [Candidatus Omnitrophica bacterium]|nr:preprotein translocase subunit YajC [Candidatus Omnitrophota bacterium]
MIEDLAYAANAAGPATAEPNPILSFMPLILMFVIFYFLLIRPQQKRQQDTQKMIQNLKKGDRIITSGGILGEITSIQEDYVVIKVGNNDLTKMEVLKSAIVGLRQEKK